MHLLEFLEYTMLHQHAKIFSSKCAYSLQLNSIKCYLAYLLIRYYKKTSEDKRF